MLYRAFIAFGTGVVIVVSLSLTVGCQPGAPSTTTLQSGHSADANQQALRLNRQILQGRSAAIQAKRSRFQSAAGGAKAGP